MLKTKYQIVKERKYNVPSRKNKKEKIDSL